MGKVNFGSLGQAKKQRAQVVKENAMDIEEVEDLIEEVSDEEELEVVIVPPKKATKPQEYAIQVQEEYKDLADYQLVHYSKDAIRESVALYRFLFKEIIKPSDFQPIGDNQFLKKSGYRKIAEAYGISLEQVGETEYFEKNGNEYAKVKVKASLGQVEYEKGLKMLIDSKMISVEEAIQMIAKLGKVRSTIGVGILGMHEIKFAKNRNYHNLEGHAYTKGANRAIGDLVGFGIVSAMEVDVNSENNDGDIPEVGM